MATAAEVAVAKETRLSNWLEANDAEMRALTTARIECLREMRDAGMLEPINDGTRDGV